MSYDSYLKKNIPTETQEELNKNLANNDYNVINDVFEPICRKFSAEISPETLRKAKEITNQYVYDMVNVMEKENIEKNNVKENTYVQNKNKYNDNGISL